MEKILLHCCCAPCSAAILEWLLQNGWQPTLFYYNPNIFPLEEYQKRKDECSRYAQKLHIDLIDGDYDRAAWKEAIAGLEQEPERGLRCFRCFQTRLKVAAKVAADGEFPVFATTLASSRWKNIEQINTAGIEAATLYPNLRFWDNNWRKNGLQERRNALLKENGFYNQTYCGCEFSMQETK